MTLLVRDEVDVVAANIAYHRARGVAAFVVTDNGSVDGTREVLRDLAREGDVEVLDEPAHTYAQSEWVTRMARRAATGHRADWVVNADADEFWTPTGPLLSGDLEQVPDGVGVVACTRVNMLSVGDESLPFAERMTTRDELSHHARGARIGGKVAHRASPDVVVAMGNHAVDGTGLERTWDRHPVEVLHFPRRGWVQHERSIRNGGTSLAANPDLPPGAGWHWREQLAALESGDLRAEFDRSRPDEAELRAGLAAGTLGVDTRVRDVLRELR